MNQEKLRAELLERLGLHLFPAELSLLVEIVRGHHQAGVTIKVDDFDPFGPEITEPERKKMSKQLLRVFEIMKDGQWRTLDQIAAFPGMRSPTQSISRYLCFFRAPQYGGHTVNRRKQQNARVFEYQVLPPMSLHSSPTTLPL